jgi:UDP-3-O-[3-hydroxymyristoyl] glucosamine N-acyltransferase
VPTALEIANFLGVTLRGENGLVRVPRSLQSAEAGAIVFMAREFPGAVERLNGIKGVVCVTTAALAGRLACAALIHPEPRLAFALILDRFFVPGVPATIAGTASVAPSARLAADVAIGQGSVVGERVQIGANTRIGNYVIIAEDSVIGCDCVIKSNTTIGEPGFGFVRNAAGRPVHFPHVGRVRIGDRVEIGANCTVVRAALDATEIDDDVKTDDHVHVAHNCRIGARTQIAAGVVLSGSAVVGRNVWIGPNATLIDYVTIGDGAHIGIGSVVVRPVDAGEKVFGNPARRIPKAGTDGE